MAEPADLELRLTGSLHPHLLVTTRAPAPNCVLHLALSIPDALFPDPDELDDLWRPATASTPPNAPHPHAWAVTPRAVDIERPFRPATPAVHVALAARAPSPPALLELDVPLHARYLPPTPAGGHNVTVFGPGGGEVRGAWVCGEQSAEAAAPQLVTVPVHLAIHLPAADPSYQVTVEAATAAVIWLGWAWIAYKLLGVVRASNVRSAAGKTKTE